MKCRQRNYSHQCRMSRSRAPVWAGWEPISMLQTLFHQPWEDISTNPKSLSHKAETISLSSYKMKHYSKWEQTATKDMNSSSMCSAMRPNGTCAGTVSRKSFWILGEPKSIQLMDESYKDVCTCIKLRPLDSQNMEKYIWEVPVAQHCCTLDTKWWNEQKGKASG